MTEKREETYQDVELIADHTHRGRHYGPSKEKDKPGDVLRLRDDQAQRLIGRKIGRLAAKDAKPLNVDGNGKLF